MFSVKIMICVRVSVRSRFGVMFRASGNVMLRLLRVSFRNKFLVKVMVSIGLWLCLAFGLTLGLLRWLWLWIIIIFSLGLGWVYG